MGRLPHCGSFSCKKMKVQEANLSPSPNGPVSAVMFVNFSGSIVDCLDQDNDCTLLPIEAQENGLEHKRTVHIRCP